MTPMVVTVQYYSLQGKMTRTKVAHYASMAEAIAAVNAYATEGSYTNVKQIDDEEAIRFTARTPGGRSLRGRNIAIAYPYGS